MTQILRNQKGQISFVIGALMVSFFSLTIFVINTGVLVSAKINLQNAADLAAYSGAATQARQLNNIAYLNYEMRRQYKKFLFRYYVLGNMAQSSQPGASTGVADGEGVSVARSWSPDGNPANNFNVPAVCIAFNENDNYCKQPVLKATPIVSSNPINIISVTTNTAQGVLEGIRQNNCSLIAYSNFLANFLWLYNTDPSGSVLQNSVDALIANGTATNPNDIDELRNTLSILKGITFGLGLVPKNVLLRERIRSIENFVNAPSENDITLEIVNGWRNNGNERALRERSVNAFLSAYQTLGQFNFRDTDILMSEIMPSGSLLQLNDMRVDFTSYYINYPNITGPNPIPILNPNPTGSTAVGTDCQATAQPQNVQNLPVGVFKDPSRLTYYAVKLQARVTGLIGRNALGLGPLDLVAYSAAQPFGSRIGPVLINNNNNQWVRQAQPPILPPGSPVFGVPNLAVIPNDDINNFGWNRAFIAGDMFRLITAGGTGFVGANGISAGQAITFDTVKDALTHAMAPNPAEMGLYSIPNDEGMSIASTGAVQNASTGDRFQQFFGRGNSQQDLIRHTIWAPIIDPSNLTGGTDVATLVNDLIEQQLAGAAPDIANALKAGMVAYVNELQNPTGNNAFENNEGFFTYTFENPLKFYREGSSDIQAVSFATQNNNILMDGSQGPMGRKALNSSWHDIRSADLTENQGRTGYSVKFISFKALQDPDTMTTGTPNMFGNGAWVNRPDLGSAANFLQH